MQTATVIASSYKGSRDTYAMVAKQIKERYGEEEVKHYDPYKNCLTFLQWYKRGYTIRPGERALKSFTFVDYTDDNGVVKKVFKTCHLFYYRQIEPRIRRKTI